MYASFHRPLSNFLSRVPIQSGERLEGNYGVPDSMTYRSGLPMDFATHPMCALLGVFVPTRSLPYGAAQPLLAPVLARHASPARTPPDSSDSRPKRSPPSLRHPAGSTRPQRRTPATPQRHLPPTPAASPTVALSEPTPAPVRIR